MTQNDNNRTYVHVVFKSHLDIGFTDYAEQVVNQYIDAYIPRALDLIERLSDQEIGFTWTTGSWLIYQFLEKSSGTLRKRMERAIDKDLIRWHALPFTLHSELTSPELFRAGLRISKELDKRFGVQTISGKFTDVPGHTQAIIPLLHEFGIKFLHIGTNPACKPAAVPSLFRWRSPDGSEVLVNYQSGYGNITECEEANALLWFAHQQDNEQPPDLSYLKHLYKSLRKTYPDAEIKASHLDRFARQILPFSERFPVVEQEIGDTWIHGVGSDPLKVSRYRALCRVLETGAESPESLPAKDLETMKRTLLLIPEHTWGMDLKRYLPDYLHYRKQDFLTAKAKDYLSLSVQHEGMKRHMCTKFFATDQVRHITERWYHVFEDSWKEQRGYIQKSLNCLQDPNLRIQMENAMKDVEPLWPSVEGFSAFSLKEPLSCGGWGVAFDATRGAVSSLVRGHLQLCRPGGTLGLYRYEIYSDREYQEFYRRYLVTHWEHCEWSLPDYTKPGLSQLKELQYTRFFPERPEGYIRRNRDSLEIRVHSSMPDKAVNLYGAPKEIMTCYRFDSAAETVTITLHWRGKDANRIPESSWMIFDLALRQGTPCLLDKMGMLISAYDVVQNGNRAMHAIRKGVECTIEDSEGRAVRIALGSRDAPLVCIGHPRILEFDQRTPDCSEGIFFNLHNNLWGTNFPMWYNDDGLFQFTISLKE